MSLNSSLTPRRSPSPSSPTLATKVIVPGIVHVRFLHRAHDRDQHRQAAAVVADPGSAQDRAVALDLHVRCLRETRVSRCAATTTMRVRRGAAILAEHVADLVDAHVLQAEVLEDALQLRGRATSSLNDGAGISQNRTLVVDRLRRSVVFAARRSPPSDAAFCIRSATGGGAPGWPPCAHNAAANDPRTIVPPMHAQALVARTPPSSSQPGQPES